MRLIDADELRQQRLYNGLNERVYDTNDILDMIDDAPTIEINGETSDGYHTFNELYHHRAVLFSVIVSLFRDRAWKSRQHHDGTMYDGMFIVGIDTPDGQATYHYDINPYWPMFDCKELDHAPEWDGHTPAQAIKRIGSLQVLAAPVVHAMWKVIPGQFDPRDVWVRCSNCMYSTTTRFSNEYDFCPHCGAKMDAK